ncbi:MAG: ROK family protein [Spirochaetia bacterium]|jgi:fructokinase|nr:ROK family protein [Spirochaetia bacterium]
MKSCKEFSDGVFASVEAGGTKFVCALGSAPDAILESTVIPTQTPEKTLPAAVGFLKAAEKKHGKIRAIGVCSFGPVGVDRDSPDYGRITTTPKALWRGTDILGAFRSAFAVPAGFDTDVNGAALGEARWGAARGKSHVLYITVGTGVGGGALVRGLPLHGLVHPEMGHIRVPHNREADPYPGACPWHGDCLEGLVCGPALAERCGKPARDIAPGDPVWDLAAGYLAAAAATFTLVLSPEIIILGGGVMQSPGLLDKIRNRLPEFLGGYIAAEPLASDIKSYIAAPGLGNLSGVAGGFVLARQAAGKE